MAVSDSADPASWFAEQIGACEPDLLRSMVPRRPSTAHPRVRLDPSGLRAAMFRAGFAPRRQGEPFTQQHKDFAAALQQVTEEVALHMITHWRRVTEHTRLAQSFEQADESGPHERGVFGEHYS